MAAATVTVDCPECHEALEVPLKATAASSAGDRLVLTIEPDTEAFVAHMAVCEAWAGADV